jgi:hypothetical protein
VQSSESSYKLLNKQDVGGENSCRAISADRIDVSLNNPFARKINYSRKRIERTPWRKPNRRERQTWIATENVTSRTLSRWHPSFFP